MPEDVKTAAVETETGFGTGLRAHVKARRGRPEPPVEVDPEEQPAEPEPSPEPTAEEEALLELERELSERAAALDERERLLTEHLDEVRTQAARLVELKAELDAATPPPAAEPSSATETPGSARHHLRDRIEREGDLVWEAFASGLGATKGDGSPDFRTRLLAATALLAEAYGESERPPVSPAVPAASELKDELANLRAARRARKS